MKRALLTGATGFVGANLARRLLDDGHQVHLLVRAEHTPWRIEEIRGHVHLHLADLRDAGETAAAVARARPDWVFHLAAHGAYSQETGVERILTTNVLGTAHLVEACLDQGFEAFVNTGSSSEYGLKDHPPPEDEWLDPNSHYAVAKASATLFCRFTARCRNVRIPTLRLYSVYGPWEEPTRLMPALLLRGLEGRLPPLVDPAIARDFVYVDDVVEAYMLAAEAALDDPGAVLNVGTGQQTTLGQAVEVARGVLDVEEEPAWGSMPDRHWDTDVWVADSRRIREVLGWRPRHDFEQGFRRMSDWLRQNPDLRRYYAGRLAGAS